MQWIVSVNKDKCTGCGECIENCPGDVFELIDGKSSPMHLDECHGCHTCEAVCDFEAVQVEDGE